MPILAMRCIQRPSLLAEAACLLLSLSSTAFSVIGPANASIGATAAMKIATAATAIVRVMSYLASPAVAAIGGSWIAPHDRIRAGDWEAIAGAAAAARATVRGDGATPDAGE